jgi:hypothetical protein
MKGELRKILALIAYTGIQKKVLARHIGVNKYTFAEYIHGDRPFPPDLKEKLIERLKTECRRIEEDEKEPLLEVAR